MGRSDTDPRKNFVKDLNDCITGLKKTAGIILIGDFNDDLTTASGMMQVVEHHNLIDIHWALHGSDTTVTCDKSN